jgi:hypothetical protein
MYLDPQGPFGDMSKKSNSSGSSDLERWGMTFDTTAADVMGGASQSNGGGSDEIKVGSKLDDFPGKLVCAAYNNDENPWGERYPRDTYDPSLPLLRTGEEILYQIGAPGLDKPPYYIAINGIIVEIRRDFTDPAWEFDANGKRLCVENQYLMPLPLDD